MAQVERIAGGDYTGAMTHKWPEIKGVDQPIYDRLVGKLKTMKLSRREVAEYHRILHYLLEQ